MEEKSCHSSTREKVRSTEEAGQATTSTNPRINKRRKQGKDLTTKSARKGLHQAENSTTDGGEKKKTTQTNKTKAAKKCREDKVHVTWH